MAHDPSQRVAANIRAELARRSIKITQLAQDSEMSRRALYRRLSGEQAFDVTELAKIADYLGVSVAFLLEDNSAAGVA